MPPELPAYELQRLYHAAMEKHQYYSHIGDTVVLNVYNWSAWVVYTLYM